MIMFGTTGTGPVPSPLAHRSSEAVTDRIVGTRSACVLVGPCCAGRQRRPCTMNVDGMPRTKSFSVEEAVDKVTELCRRRGHTALSMQEAAEALGLSRSSIYATWGDKPGLFAAVLRRYGPSRAPGLSELRTASAPRAALVRLFEQAPAIEREPCLLIDTLVEFVPADLDPEIGRLVGAVVPDLEKCLADAIRRGQAAGEIAPAVDPTQAGQVLLALYLGLYVLIRTGTAEEPVLGAVVRQVEATLPAPVAVSG